MWFNLHQGLNRASLVAQMVKNLPAMQETLFDPWVGKISWRREWQPTPVFLCREFRGQTMGSQRVGHDWVTNTTRGGQRWSTACNAGGTGLTPGWRRSRRREWKPTPGFLPGKSHGQRRLAGCSPCGRKSWTRLVTKPPPPKKHKLLSYM